jgi:hypothetical protein
MFGYHFVQNVSIFKDTYVQGCLVRQDTVKMFRVVLYCRLINFYASGCEHFCTIHKWQLRPIKGNMI